MTSAELFKQADELDAQARELREQGIELHRQELLTLALEDRLVYAADARCPCGAGLAYDPAHDDKESPLIGPSYWDCSAILLGKADATVKHTGQLPFAFYSINSENQPSVCGRTTRPVKT